MRKILSVVAAAAVAGFVGCNDDKQYVTVNQTGPDVIEIVPLEDGGDNVTVIVTCKGNGKHHCKKNND